ncbi:MAG: TasA family protein [Candidatus Pacebacteria bacterium]|nr:TasA family protein [Candidatus Paceibacterota bacterium]
MKRILLSLSVIAAVAIGAVGATRAYFSDTETSTGNTFTAGTLDITLGTATYTTDVTNMKPGDVKTLTLNVNNVGSLPLNYTVSTALSGAIMSVDEDLATSGLQNPNAPVVSAVRVDGVATTTEALSAVGGTDASDAGEVDITFPAGAGNGYQGLSGNLGVTFDAVQQ